MSVAERRDYSLVGAESVRAVQKGLAGAAWYMSPVPKEKMRELLERRDGPAVRDTPAVVRPADRLRRPGLRCSGASWWAVLPFAVYGVLYGSTSDSRWHEPLHGTAFKTDWLNNALVSTGLVHGHARGDALALEPHAASQRHDHRGARSGDCRSAAAATAAPAAEFLRRAEPAVLLQRPAPPLPAAQPPPRNGPTFPQSNSPGSIWEARIHLAIYAAVIALAFYDHSILPLDVRRPAQSLRLLADAHLRLYAARRPGRGRAGPPAQLPHGLHEPREPLPVLEHELSPRAPHVPAGALL